MSRFDPTNSDCLIYTRRKGVLSAIGHDLELVVGVYEVEIDRAVLSVRGRFDAGSLRVVGAVQGGAVLRDAISARDRTQIERQIAEDVLAAARYPHVEFASTQVALEGDGWRIRGQLRLHGVERAIAFDARRIGNRTEADVTIHQPDFGITPFRAFGGALRVHPDVRVLMRLRDLSP